MSRSRTGWVAATLIGAGWAASMAAQAAPERCAGEHAAKAVTQAFLPAGFVQVQSHSVTADGVRLQLIRHQAAGAQQPVYGGPHFSVLANAGGCPVGFIRLTADSASGEPPGQDEARAAAVGFLRRHAPDLLASYSQHSISEQSQTLQVNGQAQRLRGTMVKTRNRADGSWFWVVVGSDGQVMLFERDLRWSNVRFSRATERWLYDDWRAGR